MGLVFFLKNVICIIRLLNNIKELHMISDADLLKLVMDRFPEQPSTFIIEQFVALKAGLIQANNKLAGEGVVEPTIVDERPVVENTVSEEPVAPKKKYSRRSLVVKPEEAITGEHITCCICGKKFQNLTTKHIASHGINVEEYKKLCGYSPEQRLLSSMLLKKLQENVQKAQGARGKSQEV